MFEATIVYEQIWDAINEKTDDGEKKYKYFVLEGSSRSSKTRSLLQIFYTYAYQNVDSRLSVWRDTAKDCRDTVLHDMNKVYPSMQDFRSVGFNKTQSIFSFPTKCTIEICGTDEPNKVHGFQGEVVWLNEPYNISRDTFDQLDMRTADIFFIDWNPKQSHWVEEVKQDPRCKVLHSTFKDNPFCPDEQRRKILSYQSVKKCEIVINKLLSEDKAKLYDCLINPLQLPNRQIKELIRCKENEAKHSANDFNWDVYGLGIKSEKPHRIFHFEEVDDEVWLKIPGIIYYAVDWGKVDPWAVLAAKYYDGTLYLHEINYLSENLIREKLSPVELAAIQSDEEAGLVSWYWNKFNIPRSAFIICDPNRPMKILALRALGYDYAVAAKKPPGSIVDGISGVSNMRVCFSRSSKNIKYEQENYSNKVDRYGVVLEDPEDINNHLMDDCRYIYMFLCDEGIIKI